MWLSIIDNLYFERESKNKRRLLTYRGLYGRDQQQLNVTDSPKFQIESLKNNALVRNI